MQKNSTYNKIKEIIATAQSFPEEINSFSERLQSNANSFVYYKRDGDQTIEAPCSIGSIKRNINLCVDLGLIQSSESCALTEEGIEGLDTEKFDSVLRMVVLGFIDKNGASWSDIENAIENLDYADPESIYKYLSIQISEEDFRKLLFLLSLCGLEKGENILHGYIKKTYLTDKIFNEI